MKKSGTIHLLSLGAGVQSSTLALMSAAGEVQPMPVAAVFADTMAEPPSVYRWLDWLEKQLPFPVMRVSKGSLEQESYTVRMKADGSGKYCPISIPAYTEGTTGTGGILSRQCTSTYKLRQLQKASRIIMRKHNAARAIYWIGISVDEAHRMKDSRDPRVDHRWPLIEMGMRRQDCLNWMQRKGFPKPSRSACYFCPFHSTEDWRNLKRDEPEYFQKAIEFERKINEANAEVGAKGKLYLHNSRVPIGEVDFSNDSDRGQMLLFGNECLGMCGV